MSASERRIQSPSISAAAVSAIRDRVLARGELAERMQEIAFQAPAIDAQKPPRFRVVLRLHVEGEPGGDHGGAKLAAEKFPLMTAARRSCGVFAPASRA